MAATGSYLLLLDPIVPCSVAAREAAVGAGPTGPTWVPRGPQVGPTWALRGPTWGPRRATGGSLSLAPCSWPRAQRVGPRLAQKYARHSKVGPNFGPGPKSGQLVWSWAQKMGPKGPMSKFGAKENCFYLMRQTKISRSPTCAMVLKWSLGQKRYQKWTLDPKKGPGL